MKTKILILAVVLFSSINIFASNDNRNETTYSNTESYSKNGYTKEYIHVNKETLAPLKKMIYKFDSNGNRIERLSYKWDSQDGWVGTQKIEYFYSKNNEPIMYTYTEWNQQLNTWANQSQSFAYGEIDKKNSTENKILSQK